MNINLHIERLVLDGVSVEPHRQTELKAVVELELSRLLVLNGIGSGMQSSNRSRVVSSDLISIGNTHNQQVSGNKLAMLFIGV